MLQLSSEMSYNLYMQRILLVLRHGKSKWGEEFESDFERPLNKRGQRAAKFIGKHLKKQELAPDAIVTSPAERAVSTAELIGARFELGELFLSKQIYHAGCSTLLEVVAKLDDEWQTVLLVGHNPGLEELVDQLSGSRDTLLKTCSLAVLSVEADSWATATDFKLEGLFHPRELMGEV